MCVRACVCAGVQVLLSVRSRRRCWQASGLAAADACQGRHQAIGRLMLLKIQQYCSSGHHKVVCSVHGRWYTRVCRGKLWHVSQLLSWLVLCVPCSQHLGIR